MVGAGVEAVFRCQDPTAHVIVWRVNGSTVGQRPPPNITTAATQDGSGSLVNTLTILALLEYNGTEVECEAITDSLTKRTPLVTILIQGSILLSTNHISLYYLSL